MLDLLMRAAGTGAPCPSNFALMDALDLASPDGVRKHLAILQEHGVIALESAGQRRRVTLLATGARTDWSRTSGHARAGAKYCDGWGNGSDAILLRLADAGLDLATMATRLGRTPSSVRHRLRRLRAAGAARRPPEADPIPMRATAAAPPSPSAAPRPLRRDVVTHDPDRPADESAQIAAFLAAGRGRVLPPAYVGAVRGGTPLTGQAPISALARRVLLVLEDTPRSAAELAFQARLDPLLMPEILRDLADAALVTRHASRRRGGLHPVEPRYSAGPRADAMIEALGLAEARAARRAAPRAAGAPR
ncbi:hypothetical protein F1188_07035 [Roseospira marina]|uniref:Uncharacterized protein n=1 Tax=Roseospira marina TaxID=140057 RepID=A0A5M6ID23_9PROT|nr:hypothetical protein F1188_07035 [Roseospira marina]